MLCDIDRIAAPDYTPTATDMHAVQGRSLAVIELHATYKQTDAGRRFVKGRALDVTLRFMAPESNPRFNASIGYDFTNISNIALLVNQDGDCDRSSSSGPLHDGLIECVRCLSSTIKASWFPRDKRVIVVFHECNVELKQARAIYHSVTNGLHRALYPPISPPSQTNLVCLPAEQEGGCTVNTLMNLLVNLLA